MNIQFDVNYFITKFSAIPEEKWTVHSLCNNKGQRCAIGHCLPNWHWGDIANKYTSDEVMHLSALLEGTILINNGEDHRYQQPSPKKRILAALMDIKKAQYPELSDPPVYIETYVKEQQLMDEEEEEYDVEKPGGTYDASNR